MPKTTTSRRPARRSTMRVTTERKPTDKMLLIEKLCRRPDGASSLELMAKTGENKHRSKWSLSKLAERLGYRYEAYYYDYAGDRKRLHHFFIPKGGAKVVPFPKAKSAAPKVAAASLSAEKKVAAAK